jgi:2-methylcitrate dehydratase PrpD
LGLAGSQASGSFAAMGTMAVKFHQLHGAQAAVISAVHAQHSLTGATNVLTASDGGLLRAFSDDPDPSQLTDDLGARWSLLDIALRPYPAASTLQSLINVLVEPEALGTIEISDVREVRVELPDEAYRLGAEAGWESELRAMQSARFVAAGALLTRQCWIGLFAEEQRNDQRIDAFAREKVSVVRNSELRDGAVRVTLVTSAGERRLASDAASGDPLNPMTNEQLLEKVRRCFSSSRVSDSFDRERLVHLQRESSIATLLKDLREA